MTAMLMLAALRDSASDCLLQKYRGEEVPSQARKLHSLLVGGCVL